MEKSCYMLERKTINRLKEWTTNINRETMAFSKSNIERTKDAIYYPLYMTMFL